MVILTFIYILPAGDLGQEETFYRMNSVQLFLSDTKTLLSAEDTAWSMCWVITAT